jgi:hypothetical protein
MRTSYLALVSAGALLLGVDVSAEAAGRGGGGIPHGAVAPLASPGLSTANQNLSSTRIGALPSSASSGGTSSGGTTGIPSTAHVPNPWQSITSPTGGTSSGGTTGTKIAGGKPVTTGTGGTTGTKTAGGTTGTTGTGGTTGTKIAGGKPVTTGTGGTTGTKIGGGKPVTTGTGGTTGGRTTRAQAM